MDPKGWIFVLEIGLVFAAGCAAILVLGIAWRLWTQLRKQERFVPAELPDAQDFQPVQPHLSLRTKHALTQDVRRLSVAELYDTVADLRRFYERCTDAGVDLEQAEHDRYSDYERRARAELKRRDAGAHGGDNVSDR